MGLVLLDQVLVALIPPRIDPSTFLFHPFPLGTLFGAQKGPSGGHFGPPKGHLKAIRLKMRLKSDSRRSRAGPVRAWKPIFVNFGRFWTPRGRPRQLKKGAKFTQERPGATWNGVGRQPFFNVLF